MSEHEKQIRKWLAQIAIKDLESMWLDQKYYLTIQMSGSNARAFTLAIHSASLDRSKTSDIKTGVDCSQECVKFYLGAIAEFERETVAMNKGPKSKVVETQEIGRAIRDGQSRYHGQIIAFLDEIASGKLNSNASIILGEEFVVCVKSRAEAVDVSVRRRYTNDYHNKCFSDPALTDTVCAWIEEKLSNAIASSPTQVEEGAGSPYHYRLVHPDIHKAIAAHLLGWFDGTNKDIHRSELNLVASNNFLISVSKEPHLMRVEVSRENWNPHHIMGFVPGTTRAHMHRWVAEKLIELNGGKAVQTSWTPQVGDVVTDTDGLCRIKLTAHKPDAKLINGDPVLSFFCTPHYRSNTPSIIFPVNHGWKLISRESPTPFREDGQDVLAAPKNQSWVEQLYHDRLANKDRDCPPLDAQGKPLQKPDPVAPPSCDMATDTLRTQAIEAVRENVLSTKRQIASLQEDLVVLELALEEKIRGKCPDHPF